MKEKRTANELREIIMEEVRKNPDWRVEDVAITQAVQAAPHHASWRAAFVAGRNIAPPEAEQFTRELAGKFDLDEKPN